MSLRIGTRGSRLARAQAGAVRDRLTRSGTAAELEIVETSGDKERERPFADVGAPGVFVKEIENALLTCRVDLAVHSYKDLPSSSPGSLRVVAVPERIDAADLLVVREASFDRDAEGLPMKRGGSVGTASARREALVRACRPDVDVRFLRGNVPTRFAAIGEGRCDAVLLAAAGLKRLGLSPEGLGETPVVSDGLVFVRLDPDAFVPAPTQGAIAVQCDGSRNELVATLRDLDDAAIAGEIAVERALLARVQGGCEVPFGAYCRVGEGGEFRLTAVLARESDRVTRFEGSSTDRERLVGEACTALGLEAETR